MVVADVAVILVRPGGLTAAAPLAGRRAAAAVVRRALPAAAAGNCVDWRVSDGGDGVVPPPGLQLISVFCHLGAIFEVLRNNVIDHVGGEAEQEGGHEVRAGGSRAFICRIISDGFMSPGICAVRTIWPSGPWCSVPSAAPSVARRRRRRSCRSPPGCR